MTAPFAPREILFATDFSEVSRRAGAVAADLARRFSARLHVVHVVPPTHDPGPSAGAVHAAAAELGPGFEIVERVVSGLPARQIGAYADGGAIDLIVLGTHGRTGVTHALLGSVTEAVARHARCPVLTVPIGRETPPVAAAAPAPARCVVCAKVSTDLICTPCRALIRGQALEHKRAEETPGRRAGV